MIKAIIFDLDGTLLNTLIDLNISVNYALKSQNYPNRDLEHTRCSIGNGVAKLIERSVPENTPVEEYKKTLKIFEQHYKIHYQDNTIPYSEVFNLLKRLKQEGYFLAVCTNKLQDVAVLLIEKFFPKVFDIIQGDVPELKKKPDPSMINNVISRFGIQKDECLYIGDTNVDEETAVNSGLDYYLVTYGYRTKDELKEMCPKAKTVDTCEELFNLLKR